MKKNIIPQLLPWLLTGCLVFLAGLPVRLYPFTHNVTSDAYEEGTLLVINGIRSIVSTQISAQFPQMSSTEKEALVSARLNETLRQENARVRKAFEDASLQLLKQKPDSEHYLLASDGYYFLNLTENILAKGDVSTQIKGSRYFNTLMLAPLGYWEPHSWHPYIGAWITRAIRLFAPETSTMSAVAWTPIVLLPFAIAAFLFACRASGCSIIPSFTAAVFFVMASIYVKRSTYAWYDNDSYAVIFPALILGCLFMALRSLGHTRKFILYSALGAASLALYSMFWSGWVYLWALTLVAMTATGIKYLLLSDPRINRIALSSATLLVLTLLLVAFLIGLPQIGGVIQAAWGELQKFTNPAFKSWPDLFVVVGELKKGSWADIAELGGGTIPLCGAAISLCSALYLFLRKRIPPSDEIIILAAFSFVTCMLGLSAQRFIILCLIPVSLLFALALEQTYGARKKLIRLLRINKSSLRWIEKGMLALMILSVVVPIVHGQRTIRSLLNPIFNSAWNRALTKLAKETPPESIINTWWTPGHFVKAIAQRPVTFDGASIKGEQAYWLTKIYLANDERTALGILRMLNTSSNRAAEYLQSLGLPLSMAVPLLLEITRMPETTARQALRKIVPEKTTEEILQLTHALPPPSYMLIYNEIAENNPMLGYVGKWDFSRIEKLNQTPAALKKIPARGSAAYTDFLWSLVGGPFRQSPIMPMSGRNGSKEIFADTLIIDTDTMTAEVRSKTYGQGIPYSIVYLDPHKKVVTEKPLPGASLSYSIVYFSDGQSKKAILMDRILANSLIVKMYYFEGKGLEYFEPFTREQDLTGRTRIFIYKINWPSNF